MNSLFTKKKKNIPLEQTPKLATFQQLAELGDTLVLICNEHFEVTYMNSLATSLFKFNSSDKPSIYQYIKDIDKLIRRASTNPVKEAIVIPFGWTSKEYYLTLQSFENQALIVLKDLEVINQLKQDVNNIKITAEGTIKAKSMFLANMSHELRTPLNAIIGMSELLTDTSLEPSQKDLINNINQSGNILYDLINTILDFSKLEANQMGLEAIPININQLMSELHTLFAHQASVKKIDLYFETEDHIPHIIGDPTRLRQILVNIIGNAIKFTHIGSVKVQVKMKSFVQKNTTLEFTVEDTGIGFSSDVKEKIFMPFAQVDESITRQYGGTGLGLPISKSLVDLHGGTMDVTSAIGKGAKFIITIPFTLAPTTSLDSFIKQTVPNTVTAKILVAEDNQTNQKLLTMQLKNLNYDVSVVENGQQAVEEYFENDYDVIIMDCQMPIMDGFCATLIIRQQEELFDRHVPIIALTASALKEDKEKCIESGMDDFITKPVKIETLNKTIQHWLAQSTVPKE